MYTLTTDFSGSTDPVSFHTQNADGVKAFLINCTNIGTVEVRKDGDMVAKFEIDLEEPGVPHVLVSATDTPDELIQSFRGWPGFIVIDYIK